MTSDRPFHLAPSVSLSLALALSFIGGDRLSADWLVLKDGRELRGVDARRRGSRYRFLLENGVEISVPASRVVGVRKAPADERVEFRGESVTLRDKARTLARERRETEKRMVKLIETWATGKRGSEEAMSTIRGLPEAERGRYLTKALLESKRKSARLLAAREIAACSSRTAIPALAAAAVQDSYRSVRDSSLRSLKLFEGEDVSGRFLPYLRSSSPNRRMRAANALAVFPDRRAVPAILETMHMVWSGFGRGYFAQITQLAYIADYELVSGGTGFSIIEVADPIVRTTQTGVALDVDVRKVEAIARLRALVKCAGRDLGTDLAAWRRWWQEEGRLEVREKSEKPAADSGDSP